MAGTVDRSRTGDDGTRSDPAIGLWARLPGEAEREWVRDYALLALRIDRRLTADGGTVLIYRGPAAWSARVAAEEPPPAGRLVADADALVESVPWPDPARRRYLRAQLTALRAAADWLAGARPPLPEYASTCLGVTVDWLPEELFAEQHDRLATALPAGRGSLGERLRAWDAAHLLPADQTGRRAELLSSAIAETRRRTGALVDLPADERVSVELVSGVGYRAAGHHAGGVDSALYVNADLPFQLADLCYVVAHEGHPGHIAESVLKERELLHGRQRLDHWVRFMPGPSFVLSEGLGLHAEELVFPGDEAQRWLTDHVLRPAGIAGDGSDFAAIHRARNVFFGAWGNAALLAAEGRPEPELIAYLTRWALLSDDEARLALSSIGSTGMAFYVLGYFHGWRLLDTWLAGDRRAARVRRLLTEQLLPADLVAD
ncbi:hypothetical protein RM844_18320 [Streptomyces sp. DSM 44915]|uniref:DUF885 domain-containing protein n=1 Tax=Streptomyces chisholmiae TaxID=3075540 RepID=A0ABU2JU19_9ACTN|nr:hypothetical protein [Streptomyces sp. DSM 44915]MDT0268243.1 hypothetical protein [Streptomyces sp. DSM 44915]